MGQTQILNDIASNQLADVSWVVPTGQASDHGAITDGSGPSWVASVVNAIGNSPYWANTAILSHGMTGEAGTITFRRRKCW